MIADAQSRFESAIDAVITGDIATLERLLGEDPQLIRERSTLPHRAMLLHYVSANGVEDDRQKTPTNAVAVARLLLRSGADADAVAEMYGGGSTTLGLVASSVHPLRAGVQGALIETLLDAGAAIDGLPGGWEPLMAAIANGRREAAEMLASRGARLNIASAAAVGRLDAVKRFVDEDGLPRLDIRGLPAEPKAQMEIAFIWACAFGRSDVAEYLLSKGVNPGAQDTQGETGLHLAAHGAHAGTVRMLLARHAPLEVKNVYGGTVLGQTTWAVMNDPQDEHALIVEILIDAGARVDQADYPTGNEHVDEVLRRHGAAS